MDIIPIIIGVAALIVGIILGKIIFAKNTAQKLQEAEIQAQKIISEGQLRAETLKKEKELEAKEKFVQMRADHEREVLQRTQKISEGENRIKQKEQSLNAKEANVEKQLKENEAIKEAAKVEDRRAKFY
ncbi:MAG: DUF3552 domain-containing protein [Pedobacter sp.]|nr:MAG: DUF3552 domain-containing protein [Pedobacter sp.]